MTERDVPEPRQAELLWSYVQELKQAADPPEVNAAALIGGETSEVVGLMETAAEAHAMMGTESAASGSREAVRLRLREAMQSLSSVPERAPLLREGPSSTRLPAWLVAPLSGRSTGWVVAVVAVVALLWMVLPHSSGGRATEALSHRQTIQVMPELIAGTLDPDTASLAWAHLNRCRECLDIYKARWLAIHPAARQHGWNPNSRSPVLVSELQPPRR